MLNFLVPSYLSEVALVNGSRVSYQSIHADYYRLRLYLVCWTTARENKYLGQIFRFACAISCTINKANSSVLINVEFTTIDRTPVVWHAQGQCYGNSLSVFRANRFCCNCETSHDTSSFSKHCFTSRSKVACIYHSLSITVGLRQSVWAWANRTIITMSAKTLEVTRKHSTLFRLIKAVMVTVICRK